jgi:hypothetical protein
MKLQLVGGDSAGVVTAYYVSIFFWVSFSFCQVREEEAINFQNLPVPYSLRTIEDPQTMSNAQT